MKLVHPDWNHQIILDDGASSMISFENPEIFRKYFLELQSQIQGEDGKFVLSQDSEELSFSSNLLLIPSVLSIDMGDKRVQNRLQSLLKAAVISDDLFVRTQEIISLIERYAEEVSEQFPYSIRYNEPDSSALLKLIGFEAEYEYANELDKILEYMNLMHSFCNIPAFVLVGMSMYFTSAEIQMLVDDCRSLKHSILFLEGILPEGFLGEISVSQKLIIDSDGCEIFSEG